MNGQSELRQTLDVKIQKAGEVLGVMMTGKYVHEGVKERGGGRKRRRGGRG